MRTHYVAGADTRWSISRSEAAVQVAPVTDGAPTAAVRSAEGMGDAGAASTATLQILKRRQLRDLRVPCSLRIQGPYHTPSGQTRHSRTTPGPRLRGDPLVPLEVERDPDSLSLSGATDAAERKGVQAIRRSDADVASSAASEGDDGVDGPVVGKLRTRDFAAVRRATGPKM